MLLMLSETMRIQTDVEKEDEVTQDDVAAEVVVDDTVDVQSDVEDEGGELPKMKFVRAEVQNTQVEDEDVDESVTDILDGLAIVDVDEEVGLQ